MAWAERVCDAYKRGPGLHVPKKQKTKKKEDREREQNTKDRKEERVFIKWEKIKALHLTTTFSNSSYCIRFFSNQNY